MQARTWATLGAAALLATSSVFGPTRAQGPDDAKQTDEARAKKAAQAFELVKRLAGDWAELDAKGEQGETVVSRARLTAGGSTLLETLFPGTPKEMVTAYYLDGSELLLTHYCVLGNQPQMRAKLGGAKNELDFVCTGKGTGMKSHDAKHMHEARIVFESDLRVRTEWVLFEKGKPVYTAKAHLERKGAGIR